MGILSSKGSLVFGREWSLEYAELQRFLLHLKKTVSVIAFYFLWLPTSACGVILHIPSEENQYKSLEGYSQLSKANQI